MHTVECVDTAEKLAALGPAWNDLRRRCDINSPFVSHEWLSCWWRSYGAEDRMMILVVRDNGRATAIAPFMKKRLRLLGMPAKAVGSIFNLHSQKTGILMERYDPAVGDALFAYLLKEARPFDVLAFDAVPEGSLTRLLLQDAARRTSLRQVELSSARSPYVSIDRGWEEYLQVLSKSNRKHIKQMLKEMESEGCVAQKYSALSDVDTAVEEMLQVSRKTWKYPEGTAIASSATDTAFYARFARIAAEKGWLNLWVLKRKGLPMGFAYNIATEGKVYSLKWGYDTEYARLSPGRYLIYRMLKDCFEAGCSEFDMLGHADPQKMHWTSQVRKHYKYLFFGTSAYGRLLYGTQKAKVLYYQWRRRAGNEKMPLSASV